MRFERISGWLARGAVGVAACLMSAEIAAQDVSVSEVRWTDSRGAPDELPQLKSPQLATPEELRAAKEVNYILLEFTLDPKGQRLGAARYATLPQLERFFETHFDRFRFSPGKREGKPVNTAVTAALILNPASAGVTAPDATPRLLDVAKVAMPRPKTAKRGDVFENRVVFGTVTVGEKGEVVELKDAGEEWAEQARVALKAWRFAPARRGGQPVAADVRVPFVLSWGGREGAGKRTTPRVIEQVKPIYPFAMRASGMRGEVVVDFVVDIEGRVRNAFVVRSLNPSFDDPALEAVRKWRFEPGRVGERPVATHMQVPILFQLDHTYNGGKDGIEVTQKADLSKLPEELRYDTPAKITGIARPVYPHALLVQRKEGKARVSYMIDERGRVTKAEVVEATAPEFGLALRAAVERFNYEPALKKGRPIPSFATFVQEFDEDERYQLVSDLDRALLRREAKNPQSIIALSELDRKLVPISRKPPVYPLSERQSGRAGEAVIEFVVDEDGCAAAANRLGDQRCFWLRGDDGDRELEVRTSDESGSRNLRARASAGEFHVA